MKMTHEQAVFIRKWFIFTMASDELIDAKKRDELLCNESAFPSWLRDWAEALEAKE